MSREGRFDLDCVQITSRSRVGREIENIREHEREEKYVNIEEKILNIVCIFVHIQKVHLFPHSR